MAKKKKKAISQYELLDGKRGSNRNVKDQTDEDITQKPEMIWKFIEKGQS